MKGKWQLGRLRVEWFKSEMNYHGPRIDAGTATDRFETLRKGGKVINLHVANAARTYRGWRFIRYSADGSWRCLDLFWMLEGERH